MSADRDTLGADPSWVRRAWHGVRARVVGGLLVVLPLLITVWAVHWLLATIKLSLIDPLARVVLWKLQGQRGDEAFPEWFEGYVAPVIALGLAVASLYVLGFLAQSRVRRAIDWVILRVPLVSIIYDSLQKVFQTLDRQREKPGGQRVVLVAFPHPGMRVPAFVTGTCRDRATQRLLLCVYVPTTPVPTSGFFLLVPEEEVRELDWSPEQAVQAIISGGLTVPAEVSYFGPASSAERMT